VAFSDLGELFDKGKLKPLDTLTAETRAMLAGLEVIVKNAEAGDGHLEVVHKIKVWDKLKALELLARHLRLLEPEGQPPVAPQQLIIRIQPAPHHAPPDGQMGSRTVLSLPKVTP